MVTFFIALCCFSSLFQQLLIVTFFPDSYEPQGQSE